MDQNLDAIRETVAIVRELYPTMPLQQFAVLIEVVNQEGITSPELSKRLNMTGASVSRSLQALGKHVVFPKEYTGQAVHPTKVKGLELIETRPDVEEPRRHAVWLTPKGQELASKMRKAMSGGL